MRSNIYAYLPAIASIVGSVAVEYAALTNNHVGYENGLKTGLIGAFILYPSISTQVRRRIVKQRTNKKPLKISD